MILALRMPLTTLLIGLAATPALAQNRADLGPAPLGNNNAPPISTAQLDEAEARALEEASGIGNPGDRALAFDRVARAFLAAAKLDAARNALDEGETAALAISSPLVRDLRLRGLVNTADALAQRRIRDAVAVEYNARTARPAGERLTLIDAAQADYARAARLAQAVTRPDFKCEAISRVAAAQAVASKDTGDFARAATPEALIGPTRFESPEALEWLADSAGDALESTLGTDARIRVETDLATAAADARRALQQLLSSRFHEQSEALLTNAHATASSIPFPIFRDAALVNVAATAAASNQFRLGMRLANTIESPRARLDALVRLADAESRDGLESEATAAYQGAVDALVAMPANTPRETFGTILLESLIAVGRFEDARSVAALAQDPEIRTRAYSLVARAMGERGLGDSASQWIDQIPEPALRDRLRRESAVGLADWIRRGRTSQQSGSSSDVLFGTERRLEEGDEMTPANP